MQFNFIINYNCIGIKDKNVHFSLYNALIDHL